MLELEFEDGSALNPFLPKQFTAPPFSYTYVLKFGGQGCEGGGRYRGVYRFSDQTMPEYATENLYNKTRHLYIYMLPIAGQTGNAGPFS